MNHSLKLVLKAEQKRKNGFRREEKNRVVIFKVNGKTVECCRDENKDENVT